MALDRAAVEAAAMALDQAAVKAVPSSRLRRSPPRGSAAPALRLLAVLAGPLGALGAAGRGLGLQPPGELRPALRWAQTNTSVYLTADWPRGSAGLPGCAPADLEPLRASLAGADRVELRGGCKGGAEVDDARWELELREDVDSAALRSEPDRSRDSTGTGVLLTLRKSIAHRWDRLLQDEAGHPVSKDWNREDRNLPEEDEVELPRAGNIKVLDLEGLAALAAQRPVVVAMRYPWCTICEDKDKGFVKSTKVAGAKARFSNVAFATVDLREEKEAARRFAMPWGIHECRSDGQHCPLLLFKPDEPLDEPYAIQLHLLVEMSEEEMMSDPMAGAPGHVPKGKGYKPNFDRFEADLALVLPPALPDISDREALQELRGGPNGRGNVLVGYGLDREAFRRAGRRLRGLVTLAWAGDASLLGRGEEGAVGPPEGGAVELWAAEATPARTPLRYAPPGPLDADELVRFARVNVQPIVANYTYSLKEQLDDLGLPIAVLWTNFSDQNRSETTHSALQAFTALCDKRRGLNATRHILCCRMDHTYAYYQREYGTAEPYPFPYVGLTTRLGFGEARRWGYPFKEPVNKTVVPFFRSPKKAAQQLGEWVGRVASGRVPVSHESAAAAAQPKWVRGTVLDVTWKTFQKEVNGSTADVLLELYDSQRKKAHMAKGTMGMLASALKDYSSLKVARMETSQNWVPERFGRKKYAKETEYYWVPPSLAEGEWAPEDPVRYTGEQPPTAEGLLKFLKKHSLSHWSLKEAIETVGDLEPEVMGRARGAQREDDRAEEEKQRMIQQMMATMKKEKNMVDVGEMMGLKQTADAMGLDAEAAKKEKEKEKKEKKAKKKKEALDPAEREAKLREQRQRREAEERRLRDLEKKDKEKRKKRKEADKLRKEQKKKEDAEALARHTAERELRRKKLEEERALTPATSLFSWGQSRDQVRVSVSVPNLNKTAPNVTFRDDRFAVRARDARGKLYTLEVELREMVVPENCSWSLRYSEEKPLSPVADGLFLTMRKHFEHRWDRLAQNHSAVKPFMRKDWVQDDGELDEEKEDVDLPSGPNLKRASAKALRKLVASNVMVVAALRFPWCDKCAEKDREFAKAARTSKDKDHLGMVTFAVVDAREEKRLAKTHNQTCVDTCELLIFKQDEPEEPYVVPGRRYAEEIQIDCYKHLLPVVHTVETKDTLVRVTSAFDTAIVGFFGKGGPEDPWYPRFRSVARQLRGHALFGATFGGRSPRDFGIDHDATPALPRGAGGSEDGEGGGADEGAESQDGRPLVLLFKPKENRHVEFTGELTLEKLTHFSRVLSVPLISTYEFENRHKLQELKVPLGMMWMDGMVAEGESEENGLALKVLTRLAVRFSGHLVFVTLNNTREGIFMKPMGLDPRRVPQFGIATSDDPDATRFGFEMPAHTKKERRAFWRDQDGAYGRLESFCQAFLDGTLEASHESMEMPRSYQWPGPGTVQETVWKTFRDDVYRSEQDVLLELYAPMRPQHRTYVTALDLVAEALRDVPSVKVVRMDTANNYVLPEFGITEKEKEKPSSIFFLRAAPEMRRRPKRFARGGGRPESLPEKLVRFVHREAKVPADWDVGARTRWVSDEAAKRILRLRALEKDYEKKMQEEWMQKEMEEFERYKRLGRFDNMPDLAR